MPVKETQKDASWDYFSKLWNRSPDFNGCSQATRLLDAMKSYRPPPQRQATMPVGARRGYADSDTESSGSDTSL